MFFIDPLYLIFLLPGLALAGLASILTRTTFAKYSRYASASGLTGAAAARRLLDNNNLTGVRIEMTQGLLSDHYNPLDRTLRLSPEVYRSNSLAAIGVACHEAGHALQHAEHYAPLAFRSALVPVTRFGSNAAYIFILAGLLLNVLLLAKIGVLLFSAAVLFSLVTLPVEWDASARAKRLMVSAGIVAPTEAAHAAKVLNAAFLTYVAAAVTAIMTLLYYLMRTGLLGGRR